MQDDVSDALAAITARLAAHHDGLTILRAVTDACATLLHADATGVLIVDPRGGTEVLAASDERAWFVELLQAQSHEGPCLDCIRGNVSITSTDVDTSPWPHFASAMTTAGFHAVYAFPLRLMTRAVGGLNLFLAEPTELSVPEQQLGQALADLAVLGLTQERDERRVERLAEHILSTLNDRVRVGHAIGVIAGVLGITADSARARLAAHSVATGSSLREVSRAVTDGLLTPVRAGRRRVTRRVA